MLAIIDICVLNYPAAENILTLHRQGFVPYGDNWSVRWLQDLLHGVGSRAPIMGSDGRYHDPHTSFRLDYLMPALYEDDYAVGGAPVVQQAEHPQAQVGRYLGVQEELADLVEDGDPKKRMYGFDCDNLPPFVNLAGQEHPNTYPVIRIENVSQASLGFALPAHSIATWSTHSSRCLLSRSINELTEPRNMLTNSS